MSEQPDHLADNHATPTVGAMGAAGDATEALTAALQRHYAIPSGNAPFLTFDAIARRVSATSGATDDSAHYAALAADELAAADEWTKPAVADDVSNSREKEAAMTPYDTRDTQPGVGAQRGETLLPPPPDEPIYGDWGATPSRPAERGAVATRANRPPAQRRFAQGLVAIAAAIAIVGLLGAVLYNLGVSHRNSPTGKHAAKHAAPVVHYLGAQAKWQTVGQYPVDPYLNDQPEYFVAQSDPLIVYKAVAGNFIMQRSTDGGKIWQDIALPQQDFPGVNDDGVSLIVSPVNTQILILTLQSGPENPNCPANTASASRSDSSIRHSMGRHAGQLSGAALTTQLSAKIPASGGYSCSFQYISGNGGATWSKAQLPGGVQVGDVTLQNVVDAHGKLIGSRLYSVASANANNATPSVLRLVRSLDGGLTWTFIDRSINAQGWETIGAAATPSGSIVFAETETTVDGGHTGGDLWRSDDAGAHWTELGQAPLIIQNSSVEDLAAAIVGGKTLLYADVFDAQITASDGTPYGGLAAPPNQVFVSDNNGHTWQHAPAVGIPAGLDSPDNALGTLSNGAVVFQFNKIRVIASGSTFTITYSDTTYYAWNPGANAWLQLTPTLAGQPFAQAGVQWFVPAHDGQPETIWTFVTRGNTQYLEKCALS